MKNEDRHLFCPLSYSGSLPDLHRFRPGFALIRAWRRRFWSDPNDWNPVGVPSSGVDANVWLDAANDWSVITITSGNVENPGSGSGDMIYDPVRTKRPCHSG